MNLLWLFARYRAWRARHRQRVADLRFTQGYSVAIRMLYAGEMTADALYQKTEEAESFGDFTDWDRGIRAAVNDYETS